MNSAALRRAAVIPAAIPPPPPETERLLAGHSGARVVLHSRGLGSFVRKTAAGPEASSRLIAQAEKQRTLRMLGLPFPRIFMQNQDAAGRASFDMEYVPGRTIANAVAQAEPFDPLLVVRAVERMAWLFATGAGGAIEAGIFDAKLTQLERDCTGQGALLAARLRAQDWRGIPASPSHGDLTLENILLTSDKSVAFIDCDEPFASSFWLDFGKLFQDLSGHWCIRALYAAGAPAVRRVNAIQKLEQLGSKFRALAASLDPALPARLPQLAALGLLRALPYATDPAEAEFVCRRIEHILQA